MMIENGSFTLSGVKISGRELSFWAEEKAKSLDSKERDSMFKISFFADDHDTDEIALDNVTLVVFRGFINFELKTPEVLKALRDTYLPQECARYSRYLIKKRGDELIARDMDSLGCPSKIISENSDIADLFEAIQTLKGLPREVFIDE